MMLERQPQWLAAAWLRETGEHRPALDILRGDKPLTAQFCKALADWIAEGSKRTSGCKKPCNPWREYPPKLAASLHLATTPKEERAWRMFVAFPNTPQGRAANVAGKTGRKGRPKTLEGFAADHVALALGIKPGTARHWCKRFFPHGLLG